jgi:hypothetical protein
MPARRVKPAPNLLSAKQHEIFDRLMRVWQERLGLQGWRIERSHRPTKSMADVTFGHVSRMATYAVGDFGATEITKATIEATVVHELMHVLLWEIVNQVQIGLSGAALEAAEHHVVNTLEKLLMKGSA